MLFPESGSLFCAAHDGDISLRGILHPQVTNPAMWLFDSVPFALTALAYKSKKAVTVKKTFEGSASGSRAADVERDFVVCDRQSNVSTSPTDSQLRSRAALLESTYQPCLLIGSDDKIIEANNAFRQLGVFRSHEAAGQNVKEFFHSAGADELSHPCEEEGSQSIKFLGSEGLITLNCQVLALDELHSMTKDALWILKPQAPLSLETRGPCTHEIEGKATFTPSPTLNPDASRDLLTNFYNHQTFHERMDEEYARAKRYDSPLSIFLLDVDFFNHYTQRNGTEAADQVLLDISGILRQCSRKMDIIARFEGGTFAVILLETNQAGALLFAERIRRAINQHPWPFAPVTARLACVTSASERSPLEFMQNGVKALAYAKAHTELQVVHAWQSAKCLRSRKLL